MKNVRFSPVWLYMCVCKDEGRVNLLSQTLHLCFFWAFAGVFELNDPIMACGFGGRVPKRPDGRGSVREARPSKDSEVAEL